LTNITVRVNECQQENFSCLGFERVCKTHETLLQWFFSEICFSYNGGSNFKPTVGRYA